MDNLIDLLTSNVFYLIIAILIAIMVLITILKKLFKLFLVSVLVLVLYAGYLAYSGQKIPLTTEEILQHGSEQINRLKPELSGEKGVDSLLKLKKLTEEAK
jgi:ABC-type bacteriocin/lantibiotic exporter with double-glycine peptidase domain